VRASVFYGGTATVCFSGEANGEAVDIMIDGGAVGRTPAAGAQAFGVRSSIWVSKFAGGSTI